MWKTLEKKLGREMTSTIVPESYLIDNPDDVEKLKKLDGLLQILVWG